MTTNNGDAKSAADDEATSSEDAVEIVTEEFDPENPMVLVPRSEEERAAIPRVTLFTLGDKKYTIPKVVKPNISMGYLYIARSSGIGRAESWLCEKLLGAENYEALLNFDDLTQEQSDEIFRRAREVAFGRFDPKDEEGGNGSSTAPRKKQSKTPKSTRGSSKPKTPSTRTSSASIG